MFLALLLSQAGLAATIVQEALRRIDAAQTVSLSMVRETEEFPSSTRTRIIFRKGGYFRFAPPKGWRRSTRADGWN